MSEKSGIVKILANIMSAKNYCSNLHLLGNQLARNVSVCQSVDLDVNASKTKINATPILQLRDHEDHKIYLSK